MNDSITFVVPGKPVGKGRPRATSIRGHARMYTPEKTELETTEHYVQALEAIVWPNSPLPAKTGSAERKGVTE